MARANVDVAVCELVALLGGRCAELVPELAAILAGTRVASCTPACCNAGSVALTQRNAREAAVRALNAVGPTGLVRLPAGALLPCFAVGERRLTRVAAELLACHVATTPSLVDVLLAACAVRMTDDDPWVSVGLCQALARAGSGLAARDLSDARRFVALRARHEHAAVRAAAVRALGALGARSELAAALRDPAAAVRYAGLRALGRSTRELCRRDAHRSPAGADFYPLLQPTRIFSQRHRGVRAGSATTHVLGHLDARVGLERESQTPGAERSMRDLYAGSWMAVNDTRLRRAIASRCAFSPTGVVTARAAQASCAASSRCISP
jgi:hypothetical protein